MTIALVPVKRLEASKSRLFDRLGEAERKSLTLAMLGDVLEALMAAPSIVRTVVATPDEAVAEATRSFGAEALVRDDPGLNAAIDAAGKALQPDPAGGLLVVLGDVAGALPEDIEALCDARRGLGERAVVLAPSSDGGTAAMLRAPHDVIPSRFGGDSGKRHREAAKSAGVAFEQIPLPSLAIDLDLPEDVERFLETGRGGKRTREALAQLGWGQKSESDQ